MDHERLGIIEIDVNLVLNRKQITNCTDVLKRARNVFWDLESEVEFELPGRYFFTSKFKQSLIEFKQQVTPLLLIFMDLSISRIICFAQVFSLKFLLLIFLILLLGRRIHLRAS